MPKTFYQITKNEKYAIKNKTNKNRKTNLNNVLLWVHRLYTEFFTRKSAHEK